METNNPGNAGTLGSLQSTVVFWDDAEGEMPSCHEMRSFAGYYKTSADLPCPAPHSFSVESGEKSIAVGGTNTAKLHLRVNLAKTAKLSFWFANRIPGNSANTDVSGTWSAVYDSGNLTLEMAGNGAWSFAGNGSNPGIWTRSGNIFTFKVNTGLAGGIVIIGTGTLAADMLTVEFSGSSFFPYNSGTTIPFARNPAGPAGATFPINGAVQRTWTTGVNWSQFTFYPQAGQNDLVWEKGDGQAAAICRVFSVRGNARFREQCPAPFPFSKCGIFSGCIFREASGSLDGGGAGHAECSCPLFRGPDGKGRRPFRAALFQKRRERFQKEGSLPRQGQSGNPFLPRRGKKDWSEGPAPALRGRRPDDPHGKTGSRIMAEKKNGYEKTYEVVRPKLRVLDLPYAARRLGFELLSRDEMAINFLGRRFRVTREDVFPEDGKPVNVNYRSVLVYYASSAGMGDPLMDFALLSTFSEGLFAGSASSAGVDWMTIPLRRAFGNDYGAFAVAARSLGLIYLGSRVPGEYNWGYWLLPRIPVRLNYYEADDEFPCSVKIYYDKSVVKFLDFEPLAVLNGCFIEALAGQRR